MDVYFQPIYPLLCRNMTGSDDGCRTPLPADSFSSALWALSKWTRSCSTLWFSDRAEDILRLTFSIIDYLSIYHFGEEIPKTAKCSSQFHRAQSEVFKLLPLSSQQSKTQIEKHQILTFKKQEVTNTWKHVSWVSNVQHSIYYIIKIVIVCGICQLTRKAQSKFVKNIDTLIQYAYLMVCMC